MLESVLNSKGRSGEIMETEAAKKREEAMTTTMFTGEKGRAGIMIKNIGS